MILLELQSILGPKTPLDRKISAAFVGSVVTLAVGQAAHRLWVVGPPWPFRALASKWHALKLMTSVLKEGLRSVGRRGRKSYG